MQRRLAAILAADVVGYSKLMGEDEAGTLAALASLECPRCRVGWQVQGGGVLTSLWCRWPQSYTMLDRLAAACGSETVNEGARHAVDQMPFC